MFGVSGFRVAGSKFGRGRVYDEEVRGWVQASGLAGREGGRDDMPSQPKTLGCTLISQNASVN